MVLNTSKIWKFAALALFSAPLLHASERAVLRNGFSLVFDHQQVQGNATRLYLSPSEENFVDVPNEQIASFEKLEPGEEELLKPQSAAPATEIPKKGPTLQELVADAARRHNIDADFIHSVIAVESGGNVHAVSRKGAQGLMQLMPQTANKLGISNAFDPAANIEAGTRYLRELLARYNYDVPRALAAYNAGPNRVEQYHGVPPFRETYAYVIHIINDYNKRKSTQDKAEQTSKSSKEAPGN